ncbi:hypothetical protein HNV12_16560 [Methanococcoides sp. SA1]|nr:hypothetical protein [Methanococcoides sp. SA1]
MFHIFRIGFNLYIDNFDLHHERVSATPFLKWHLNMIAKGGVTQSIADFIQGRAATTVGSAHYLNKVKWAKEEYRRIVEKFIL